MQLLPSPVIPCLSQICLCNFPSLFAGSVNREECSYLNNAWNCGKHIDLRLTLIPDVNTSGTAVCRDLMA